MKGIRQHVELVVVVVTLAIFGETAFFNRHIGVQNSPAPTLETEIAQVEARVDAREGEALTQAARCTPVDLKRSSCSGRCCSSTRISR
jgi:Tfp pilus assembly protein FimT